jgi:exosortase/archaeosortase family protein
MKHEYSLIVRTFIAVVVSVFYNYFYFIFTPVTVYGSGFLLSLLGYNVIINGNRLSIGDSSFVFIEACIALAAYYLLFLLVIFTKDLGLKKSLRIFGLGSLLILVMNVIRVDILIILFIEASERWFETIHMVFWKFLAGIYVALVWIALTRYYKVKEIPIFSDLKELYKKSLFKKRKRKRK